MKSMLRKSIVFCSFVLLLTAGALAMTITGTAKNATTGKPSVGDSVDLLAMQQGMSVLASTKTDSSGSFKFDVDDGNSPHLVRVTHDGVGYFPSSGPLQPGVSSVSIDVYDAASKVDGISTNVDVVRLQSDGTTLQAVQLIAVKNGSNPPRALNGQKTYEFYLPEGAQIDQVMVQAPGGMPVNSSANQEGNSGKYSVSYPLKPGETRFEVAYHVPYSGQASFTPKMTSEVQHFVVMMPKSMTFAAKGGAKFAPMDDPSATIQVATNVTPATNLAFQVSGTGMLQDDQQQQASSQGGQAQAGQSPMGDNSQGGAAMTPDNRPGGGLGPPTDAPDPLHNYRVPILAGLGIVLICGAVFVVNRSGQQVAAAAPAATALPIPEAKPTKTPTVAPAPSPVAPDKTSMLLEGLKEELFQLELDKQNGRISESDYQTAKAALDQTLKRALARKNS